MVSKLSRSVEIVEAVDGAELDAALFQATVSPGPLFYPAYPFPLNVGEVGCFLSHRKVWQAIVDSDCAAGLVIEDDVGVTEDFPAALALAEAFCGPDGYVQFQTRPLRGEATERMRRGDTVLLEPRVVQRRTSAQLVGRHAAERLLAASEKIDRPVDVFLQHFWETGQRVHCIEPSGVVDVAHETGGSTINIRKRRSLFEPFAREWKRAWFRLQIARLSTQARPDLSMQARADTP